MEKNLEDLIKEFKSISNKGYIKGINNNTNSIGLTFERELNKRADSMFWADYEGIEIKCKSRFSRFPITLFTQAFDGPALYETNRILQLYGKQDHQFRNMKIMMTDLKFTDTTLYNNYHFKLKIDKKVEKIFLQIYDINFNLIEEESYIDFSTINTKLEYKLKYMALVNASKKFIDGIQHHRYYKITIYKLISFEKFIELLEKDIIETHIELRISRSGDEKGRQRNKNIVFQIDCDKLDKLFNTLYFYNHDLEN